MVLEKADSGFVTEDIPLHAWILTRNGQSILNSPINTQQL
jgi:hypothetical protein